MTNSPLVDYTYPSPNCNKPRKHKIDTITIHTMAVDMTIESCLEAFARSSTAVSCNYAIDSAGRIGLCVEEADRSWCSSSPENDHRAVTIEVASLTKTEPFECSPQAMASLIKLCADICLRNGIPALLWKDDKKLLGQTDKQNMTLHRWFANKSCPGEYLYREYGNIAKKVNERLRVGLRPMTQIM